jgi:hypothetical protein
MKSRKKIIGLIILIALVVVLFLIIKPIYYKNKFNNALMTQLSNSNKDYSWSINYLVKPETKKNESQYCKNLGFYNNILTLANKSNLETKKSAAKYVSAALPFGAPYVNKCNHDIANNRLLKPFINPVPKEKTKLTIIPEGTKKKVIEIQAYCGKYFIINMPNKIKKKPGFQLITLPSNIGWSVRIDGNNMWLSNMSSKTKIFQILMNGRLYTFKMINTPSFNKVCAFSFKKAKSS